MFPMYETIEEAQAQIERFCDMCWPARPPVFLIMTYVQFLMPRYPYDYRYRLLYQPFYWSHSSAQY